MIVLAIDSGVERTGYSIFDKSKTYKEGYKYITSGLIKTAKKNTAVDRLGFIAASIKRLIETYKPSAMIIEKLFFFKNQKTVITVSQAQGAVMLVASENKIPVEFLTPLQIKQIVTGYGQSDKASVQKMLKLQLNLNGELKQDDQADAIACGLAYCFLNKELLSY